MEARLASHLQIAALKRLTAAEGGFVTIVHKGDAVSGAILILCVEHGRNPLLFEKMPNLAANAVSQADWQPIWSQDIAQKGRSGSLDDYLARRIARDSDLWVIELDIASHTQFDVIKHALG